MLLQCQEFLRPTANCLYRLNQVRFKKYGRAIIPHRKPRWIPMARSKMFKDPPVCLIPEAEVKHEEFLQVEYDRRMNALIKYLDEDFQKFSDTGEAGRIEAELEFEEQTKLLKENEAENARIAGIRQLRLAREEEETKTKIKQRLQEAAQAESDRLVAANEFVEAESKSIQKRIRPDQLEEAILKAMDNPLDPEFALDSNGHIFRGRATKSLKVPKDKLENISAVKKDEKIVLNIKI